MSASKSLPLESIALKKVTVAVIGAGIIIGSSRVRRRPLCMGLPAKAFMWEESRDYLTLASVVLEGGKTLLKPC